MFLSFFSKTEIHPVHDVYREIHQMVAAVHQPIQTIRIDNRQQRLVVQQQAQQ